MTLQGRAVPTALASGVSVAPAFCIRRLCRFLRIIPFFIRGNLHNLRMRGAKPAGTTSRLGDDRSVVIFRATRNGVRPISGANNWAMAIAHVRPGAHSARHQDSRNDLTPCRMAWHFVSAGAHAPHSDQTLSPTPTPGVAHSARLASLCSSGERTFRRPLRYYLGPGR